MLNYFLFHYAVPVLSFTKNIYNSIVGEISYYYNTITKLTQLNELLFIENYSNAYPSAYINNLHKYSGTVTWRFDLYKNIFYSYNCAFKDTKRFPVLSASLVCDSEQINLDDFFETIKVQASNPNYPSLQQVLEVYTYKSGIVFDKKMPWKLSMLDSNINEHMLDIFKDSWSFTENTKN
jgi:hypothetical protein